jgi:transposase
MLRFGSATRVYVAIGATDMRKGFEGLFGIVRDRLLIDPLSGHVFVFCNARKNRLKILYWDGSGLWICSKRLEKGRFSWPARGDENGKVRLTGLLQLAAFFFRTIKYWSGFAGNFCSASSKCSANDLDLYRFYIA